jgi:hypothetical protein
VARGIEELKIAAGEPFSICKREVSNGQKRTVEWEVQRLESLPAAQLELVRPPGADKPVAAKSTPRSAKTEPGSTSMRTPRSNAKMPALDELEQAVTDIAGTPLEAQLRASIPDIAKLEHALKTAIAAAAGAEQFGHQLGYPVRFTPDDIRTMALTVFGKNGNIDQPVPQQAKDRLSER